MKSQCIVSFRLYLKSFYFLRFHRFSLHRPNWADSVIESPCPSVCLSVCLSVTSQNTLLRRLGRPLVKGCIAISMHWHIFTNLFYIFFNDFSRFSDFLDYNKLGPTPPPQKNRSPKKCFFFLPRLLKKKQELTRGGGFSQANADNHWQEGCVCCMWFHVKSPRKTLPFFCWIFDLKSLKYKLFLVTKIHFL